MAASERRRLFVRSTAERPVTPLKVEALRWIGTLRLCTGPQVADLMDCSEKAARNHLRDLFQHNLVARVGVPRSLLADLHEANRPELLWGRAPTIYTLTREGARFLVDAGLAEKADVSDIPDYGPKNGYFLAHELQVRDARVWLERVRRAYDHAGVTAWKDGKRAVMGRARPDAWFTYALKEGGTLLGLVEIDRGTERAPSRWQEKFGHYAALFAGTLLPEVTGQKQGRVLVIVPDAKRRENIAAILRDLLPGSGVPPDRFWLAEKSVLEQTDLRAAVWQVPERPALMPLVPERFL